MKKSTGSTIDIEGFYSRYGPMVMRRCRQILKNEQSAYDATHEVFLKILVKQKSLTGEHPSALLYRIATNVCLNRIRDERKHEIRRYLDIVHNRSFIKNQEDETTARLLLEYVIANEKGSTRTIAMMYFINGMTIKEIAATVRLSISGVHKHLEKLRMRIREKGEIS